MIREDSPAKPRKFVPIVQDDWWILGCDQQQLWLINFYVKSVAGRNGSYEF